MTIQEKQMIASLSEKGLGYRKIAAQIGISENTVKSYLKRMTAADDQKEPDQPAAVFSCPQCGEEIRQTLFVETGNHLFLLGCHRAVLQSFDRLTTHAQKSGDFISDGGFSLNFDCIYIDHLKIYLCRKFRALILET